MAKHGQAYLSYMRGIHEAQRRGKATPVERARYNPATAAKAMGRGKPQVK